MNRFAVLCLIALMASPALHAGTYTEAVRKNSRCESAGELAKSFYGTTTADLRRYAAEIDSQAKAKKITRTLAAETKYIFFMGNTAKSEKDAYMQAWAWCMDQKK
jgi:protein-tyrosine-phosphatase